MNEDQINYDEITIDLSDVTDMAYTTMNSPTTWTATAIGGGSAGSVYTYNGTSGTSWNDTITISSDPSILGKTLQVNGDAQITGELTVQGVKLSDRLEKIEEKLAILRPNEELEEKWEQLRGLRKAYMELEAEIIEKEKVWSILKR